MEPRTENAKGLVRPLGIENHRHAVVDWLLTRRFHDTYTHAEGARMFAGSCVSERRKTL